MKTKIHNHFQKHITKYVAKHQTFFLQKIIKKIWTYAQTITGTLESMFLVGCSIIIFWQNIIQTLPEATSFIYPLQEISTIECRQLRRENLPATCKIPFPEITTTNYQAYTNNKIYQDSYSVLRGGSYTSGRAINQGAHPGIDLPTAKGTPIRATADWEVIFAGWTNWYGNNIRIKHRYQGAFIYSIYAHLESINVSQGAKISQGQKIGEVWNSWTSKGDLGGNHLHFEIAQDNNGRAKYAFLGCKDLALGDTAIIQQGLCKDEMKTTTLDPIALIIQTTPQKVATTLPKLPTNTSIDTLHTSSPLVSWFFTTSGSFQKTLSQLGKESLINRFFSNHTLNISLKINTQALTGTIELKVINTKTQQHFKGILPSAINLISSKSDLIISTQSIQRIDTSSLIIPIQAKKLHAGSIILMINDLSRGKISYLLK